MAVGRLRNSTVIVVPDVGLKWKLMKQLLMLRLASPSLRADGMKDSCRYWDARVVIEKLWSMSELKKARPKGVNLKNAVCKHEKHPIHLFHLFHGWVMMEYML